MDRPTVILAEHEGFGRIYECECGCIHLHLGPVSVSLTVEAYVELVDLVNTSVTKFERIRWSGNDS